MHDDVLERLFGELAGADVPVPPPAAVIARGRQRRRRARAQVLTGAAAAVALLGIAVSDLAGSHAPAQPSAGRPNRSTAACAAAPDRALDAELRRTVPATGQAGLTAIGLSQDGTAAYVLVTANGIHGIAEENVATGAIVRTIQTLPDSYDGAMGGVSPDGDLLWSSVHSSFGGDNGDTTPMQVWSPRTGTVSVLAPAGQSGGVLSEPVFFGAVAAWEQTIGSEREIVAANVRTGVTTVIARGQVLAPVFSGDALVWPTGLPPGGQDSHLVAVRADRLPALVPVAVPGPLRAAGQASYISSNGGQTAYFSAGLTELFYSPAPDQPARLMLRVAGFTFGAAPPTLGPGYLGWMTSSAASFVASTASLAFVRLTNGSSDYGLLQPAGSFLIAAISPDPKQVPARLSVLSGATIEGLTCATARAQQ